MAKLSTLTKDNLNKQGFGGLNDEAKSRYALPLRFTPAVAVILIVIGLALRSPIWLGAMSLVALSGAFFPRWMILDLVVRLGLAQLITDYMKSLADMERAIGASFPEVKP